MEQDAAALNSKLVVMEVALSERIAALSPTTVHEARQTMTNMLGKAHTAVLNFRKPMQRISLPFLKRWHGSERTLRNLERLFPMP